MKALVTARMNPADLDRLSNAGFEITTSGYGVTGQKLSESELVAALADKDVAIVEFEPLTEAAISSASHLKLLACCRNEPGANVDLAFAAQSGIPVLFTPGRNAIAVAEYTLALILAVARNIPTTHHLLRYTDELTAQSYSDKSGARSGITSEWSLDPGAPFQRFEGVELFGKTLGIIGFGAIGQQIAARAKAFGLNVIASDPFQKDSVFDQYGVEKFEMNEVVAKSDFITMAAKVTPETTGMFSRETFSLMKPSAFFINTARAALVDYEALYDVLAAGKIAGAALDVYPAEPLPSDSKFRSLSNIVLSPHLAGSTAEVKNHHSKMVVDDILNILQGNSVHRVSHPDVLAQFLKSGGLS
jgi:D-3-phosphoglycerate dehydrogenase